MSLTYTLLTLAILIPLFAVVIKVQLEMQSQNNALKEMVISQHKKLATRIDNQYTQLSNEIDSVKKKLTTRFERQINDLTSQVMNSQSDAVQEELLALFYSHQKQAADHFNTLKSKITTQDSQLTESLFKLNVLQETMNGLEHEIDKMEDSLEHLSIKFKKDKYVFVREAKMWSDARTDCKNRGGDLVSINSPSEWEYLLGRIHIYEHRDHCFQYSGYWTSGNDLKNKWVWGDSKEPVLYTWHPKQPLGDGPVAHIGPVSHAKPEQGYKLNNSPQHMKICYICEI